MRLSPDLSRIIGVFYSQHGDSPFASRPPLFAGTHPIVYSAIDSHANYATIETFEQGDILKPPGLAPIGWLKVVDTTDTDGIRTYRDPARLFKTVEWRPWEVPGQLVLLDGNAEAAKWLGFKGTWGPPDLDNSHIDRPPSMPENVEDRLFDLAKVASFINALPKNFLVGDGPRSPEQQGWWANKEP